MKKILCIGNSTYDITMQTNGYPTENVKYRVNKKVECGGGVAANSAYLLAQWGMTNTYYMGVIGNDLYGKRIVEEFMENNMNLDYVQAIQNHETTVSLIIANAENGSRTVFSYKSDPVTLDLDRINFPTDVDVILTDGNELDATLRAIENNESAITVIDAGRLTKNHIILGQIVDYLVASQDFAEEFTGVKIDVEDQKTLDDVFYKMEKTFTKTIIITLGEKGSIYKLDGIVKLLPTKKVKAIDSTAAGDIYHGGFTYGLANGYSVLESMKLGSIAGYLSVTKLGGRISTPSLEEVLNEYDKLS